MTPHIYILILNWNGKDVLKPCLDSILAIDYANYTTLVIDNNSSDGSGEMAKNNYLDVEYLQLKQNHGFAGGYNRCFDYLKDKNPEYILLLNNDTEVDKNILNCFVQAAEECGKHNIFGGKIFYHQNPNRLWYAGGKINLKLGWISHRGIRKTDSEKYSFPMETDYVTGCCLFTYWNVIEKLDGFDKLFSMYGEDVDLSLRFKKSGGKIFFIPKAMIWHKVSASFGSQYYFEKWKRKQSGKIKIILKNMNPIIGIIPIIILSLVGIIELLYFQYKKYKIFKT